MSAHSHSQIPAAVAVRLLASAMAGNPQAQHLVGLLYLEGDTLDHDEIQAAAWIQRAAQQGLAPAQNDLGSLYAQGRGLPKNLHQALFWLRRAASQGSTLAADNLRHLQGTRYIPPLFASVASSLRH